MHFQYLQHTLRASLIGLTVLIAACSPKDAPSENTAESSSLDAKDSDVELKEKTEAKPVKSFAATPDDASDIALLSQYETQFAQLTDELEAELITLDQQNNLSEDMKNQRKFDLIQSSLNMLKDLDLKTEQGRYIQGLYYQYWENQAKVYQELQQSVNNELTNPKDAIEGMSDYYTAQAQLQHWRSQTQ